MTETLADTLDLQSRRRSRVRISDVADALGLTKGTVSRALNGYADISDSTRLRVQRKADAMGYRPLSQAQTIRTGRARSIGLVLQANVHDAHRPFLSEFLAGLTQATSQLNWTLTVATAYGDKDMLATYDRLLDERKADGFIVPRTLLDDPRIDHLRRSEVPFVLYGRTRDPQGCAWFDIRGEDAMTEAVRRLYGLGHRRIGFVNGSPEHTFSDLRLRGYIDGLVEFGITVDNSLVRDCAVTREDGAVAAQALMFVPSPPTAILFAVDMAAIGAYGALNRLGLRIGADLSIISYDGIPEAAYTDPPLTTYGVDTRAAGVRLATMLIDRIRGTDAEDLRETVAAQLCTGGSDGPPSKTSEELARHVRERFETQVSIREVTK